MKPRLIAFLSDFGLEDPYVGIVHAVISKLAGESVRVVDVTHGIPSFNIRAGAYVLYSSYRYFPEGTIFLVVVDPGVGGTRRAIVIRTRNYIFVGPDNGVLWPAACADGILEARLIANEDLYLKPTSYTFHGRDIFAPVAAQLALGMSLDRVGPLLNPSSLIKLDLFKVEWIGTCAKLVVNYVDRFGNVALSASHKLYSRLCRHEGSQVRVHGVRGDVIARCVKSFSHVKPGEAAIYVNSFGFTEVAVYMGSAAKVLGVNVGDEVEVCPL